MAANATHGLMLRDGESRGTFTLNPFNRGDMVLE